MSKGSNAKKSGEKPRYLGRKIIAWSLVVILGATSLFAGLAPMM